MDSEIPQPYFQDADKAREYLEGRRWPDGPVCPNCGALNEATRLESKECRKPRAGEGKAKAYKTHARKGLWRCKGCGKQFSVTVGTIFEASHIPLNKWLIAYHLMCATKKGVSAHQLHRILGVSYKASWFMCHRVRHSMSQGPMNTVEGLFSLIKCGDFGTFHHWGSPYAQQYLNEFNFHYNTRKLSNADRVDLAIKAAEGKRFMLKEPKKVLG